MSSRSGLWLQMCELLFNSASADWGLSSKQREPSTPRRDRTFAAALPLLVLVLVLGRGQMFQHFSFDFLKPAEFSTICLRRRFRSCSLFVPFTAALQPRRRRNRHAAAPIRDVSAEAGPCRPVEPQMCSGAPSGSRWTPRGGKLEVAK